MKDCVADFEYEFEKNDKNETQMDNIKPYLKQKMVLKNAKCLSDDNELDFDLTIATRFMT